MTMKTEAHWWGKMVHVRACKHMSVHVCRYSIRNVTMPTILYIL